MSLPFALFISDADKQAVRRSRMREELPDSRLLPDVRLAGREEEARLPHEKSK